MSKDDDNRYDQFKTPQKVLNKEIMSKDVCSLHPKKSKLFWI